MPVSGFDPLAMTAPIAPPVRDGAGAASDSAAANKDQFNKLVDKANKADKKPAESEQAAAGEAVAAPEKDTGTDKADETAAPAQAAVPAAIVAPVVVATEEAAPVVEGDVAQVAAAAVSAEGAVEGDAASALFGDGEMSLPTMTLNGAADAATKAAEAEAQAKVQAAAPVAEEAAPVVQVQAQAQVQTPVPVAPKPKADAQAVVEAEPAVDGAAAEAAPDVAPAQPAQTARAAAQAAPIASVQVQQAAVAATTAVPPASLLAGVVAEEEAGDVAADVPAEDAAPVNPLHVATTGEGEQPVAAAPQAIRARPVDKERGDIGSAEFSVLAAGSVNVAEPTAETATAKAVADVTVVDILHRTGIEATNIAQAGAERPTVRLMPVLEQVRIGLARAVEGAPSKLSLELVPRNLGKVTIEVEATKDGQLKASIQADNPAALEVLRKDAPQLERSLQEAGYKLDHQSLSFSLRDQSQGGKGEGNGQGRANNATPDSVLSPVVEDEAPVRRSRASMGRVDVTI